MESSRTSLGRCYGLGVGRRVSKLQNLAKLAKLPLPQTVAVRIAADGRAESHTFRKQR